MRKIFWAFLFFLSLSFTANSQEKEKKLALRPDVHFRSFWMNTSYPNGGYKDDYALGMSLNLGGILTFKDDWKLHVGYRTFANVFSSEIWIPDPLSGQSNRYETGLFNVLDPRDRFFGKLETFSLEYSGEKFAIKAGRMGINTDWINAQDGRLSPTAVEGIHAWYAPDSKWKFFIWGIGRLSIRGSAEWESVGETVGLYQSGRNPDGKPSFYQGNTQSDVLGIFQIDRIIGKKGKLRFSNTLAQNLFSTYWLAYEQNRNVRWGTLTAGIQTGFQHGLGDGGNPSPELRYKDPNDRNVALSGRVGWRNENWTTHLSYTWVGGNGRWLSPREWGKDAWYTFIPRERNEGFSSVDALVAYAEYRIPKVPISLYGHFGFHWLPDPNDFAGNKYNFPSYRQLNLGLKYQPKTLKNLDVHLLLVSKEPLGSKELTPNQIYNKVELLHFNAILNWRWN